jgi:hypothetical protein
VHRTTQLARRFYHRFEPIHAVTYFAPEARAALDGLGYRGFWMGYFAARSAPLGKVPAEVVTATFYNFTPDRVAKSLTGAWQVAGPEPALRARADSAVAALRRCGIEDNENVRLTAELAGRAVRHADVAGRPLFAANQALPWPDEPVAGLWHVATLLREHRGDAHVAALTAEGVSGRESNVLHAVAANLPREYMMRARDYDGDSWNYHQRALADRGLMNLDGTLTESGRKLKDHIESRTDELALSVLRELSDTELEALFQAITPITRQVIAGGDLPQTTPMALARDDLDDGSAHLEITSPDRGPSS